MILCAQMRICFDLDNTLCAGKPYDVARPLPGAATLLKKLKAQGHTIIIFTARGMGSSFGNSGKAIAQIGQLTFAQLEEWGFPYDEVYFGKPSADLYVDDKSLNAFSLDDVEETIHDLQCFLGQTASK